MTAGTRGAPEPASAVSVADRASPLYVEGVACSACHHARDATQRAGYAERARQMRLAAARGEAHVGAVAPTRPNEDDREDAW